MAEEGNQQPGQSKSAKRRAAKKANAAAAEETAEVVRPAETISKDDAGKDNKAEAKAKAKAKPAAKPAEPPAAAPVADAEPKAKAKAKAKGKAEPKAPEAKAPEPKAPEPKAPEPKAKAKAKAESKAAAQPAPKPKAEPKPAVVEATKREVEPELFLQLDDGTGGAWEVSSGLSKKQQKRKERVDADKEAKAEPKAGKTIPGMGPQHGHIPGLAPPEAKAKAKGPASTLDPMATVLAATAPAAAATATESKESNASTATVRVPESKIGIVIGPKGSKIQLIKEKTQVSRIDVSGEVFTITGPPQAVSLAEAAIKELVEKGYMSLAFEDFAEHQIPVHPSCFPDIIGKQGAVVRKIKEELNVEVSIPEVPKNSPAGKKFKLTVAGTTANVEKAKVVIHDIMTYSHHELTHPGQVHAELDVQEWQYRFIIGKAGSELRHIQNNYKVRVNIPREHSMNQQVIVVGDQDSVDRAKTYIEKLLWNAEHAQRGRDRTDDGDVWGEEEEEDWMKAYMYKR